jgi:predicted TIM-barrel fold metal-dependent hydrolase
MIDNQWVLDEAAKDTIIVGTLGRLDPESSDFGKNLEALKKNKLFLGLRQIQLSPPIDKPAVVSNLKLLADAGLSLDTLPRRTDDATMVFVRLTDMIPSLRLIVEHFPNVKLPEDRVSRNAYMASLRELGKRPQVYIKLSEVVKKIDGKVSTDLTMYQDWLDQLWDIFGENHVIFGSDWPQSENLELNSYPNVISVARAYVSHKGEAAMEKIFWKNSILAYRWIKRNDNQPSA